MSRTSRSSRSLRRVAMGLLAVSCVLIQFGSSLALSAVALGAWLLALTLFSRPTLNRLWMPRFWGITLMFALGSGLLLGQRDLEVFGVSLSRTGLEAGALMVVRGAFLFGLVSWVSQTVLRDDIERFTGRLGMVRLGTAISVAFGLLPSLKERLGLATGHGSRRRGWRRWTGWYEVAVQVVFETARLADDLAAAGGGSRGPKPLPGPGTREERQHAS